MRCNKQIFNRMKRIQGQTQGILKMMEEQRSCEEIVTQLSAIRSSIDKTMKIITTQNLMDTIEENYNIELKNIDEALNLVLRSK